MRCPICNQPGTLINKVRKITTAAGVGAGGYLAVSGSSTGAAIGTAVCPGLGTLLGGVLGSLSEPPQEELPETRSARWWTKTLSGFINAPTVMNGGLRNGEALPLLRLWRHNPLGRWLHLPGLWM